METLATTADTTPARDAPVRERPILFSGPMVRAILDGSKSQTRRVVIPQPSAEVTDVIRNGPEFVAAYPNRSAIRPSVYAARPRYGLPGDRLWVRETHTLLADHFQLTPGVVYAADDAVRWGVEMADGLTVYNYLSPGDLWRSRPSIHMRRAHSRITLELTGVRVERLQEITDRDCAAEGCETSIMGHGYPVFRTEGRDKYRRLWDSLNEKRGYGWDVNPWVWVLSFRRATDSPA